MHSPRPPGLWPVALLLSVAAALLSALSVSVVMADGSWSSAPVAAPWNSPDADLPIAQSLQIPFEPAVVGHEPGPETPEDEALVGHGGYLLADVQTNWGVHAGSATASDDGMSRRMQDQTVVVPLTWKMN